MKNDLGFFAISLENNDYHENICHLIKQYIDNHPDKQIVLFNQFFDKIDVKNIPIMPLSHSKYFDGDLVVFDIQSLILAKGSIGAKNIYYHTQIMPWQMSYSFYGDWEYIFKQPRLKVITNSSYLYDIYNILWQNAIGISEEINYEKFSRFI